MAKSNALAILNALQAKLGWGGAHVNELDTVLRSIIDQVYADIASGGVAVEAVDVTVEDESEKFTGEDVEAVLEEIFDAIPDVAGFYTKPESGIPDSDLTTAIQTSLGKADTAYQKPVDGIPDSDLVTAIQTSLGKADTAYQKPVDGIPDSDLTAAIQASLGLADTALQPGEPVEILEGTPVNAVAGAAVFTFGGVAVDGDILVVGDDTYEFAGDADQTVAEGSIAVDLRECATADTATATLTVEDNPTAGDTMTIGTFEYIFVPDGTANGEGEIAIKGSAALTQAAILEALAGTGDHAHCTPNDEVLWGEWSSDDLVFTAPITGTIGNAIVFAETFTSENNVMTGSGHLAGGVDAPAAEAAEEWKAMVNASGTEPVTASRNDAAVTLTADVKGTAAEDIALDADDATNVTVSQEWTGCVDGTVADARTLYADETYFYIAIAANTVADTNWRRLTLGAAY